MHRRRVWRDTHAVLNSPHHHHHLRSHFGSRAISVQASCKAVQSFSLGGLVCFLLCLMAMVLGMAGRRRLVLVWLLLFVPEFCVPPLVLLWPKFDSPGASLSCSFLMSASGSQVFSLVPMAVDGRSAGENILKDVVFVLAALSLLVSGLCETDPKDMVSEVSVGAGRCESDAPGNAGCCQGSFSQSLMFVTWFSQAQCFCFMATLWFLDFPDLEWWRTAAWLLHHVVPLSSFATSWRNSVCLWLRVLELLLLFWIWACSGTSDLCIR